MTMPNGHNRKEARPEHWEYNTDWEYEQAITQWMNNKPIRRPMTKRPERAKYPDDKSFEDAMMRYLLHPPLPSRRSFVRVDTCSPTS